MGWKDRETDKLTDRGKTCTVYKKFKTNKDQMDGWMDGCLMPSDKSDAFSGQEHDNVY